MLRVDAAHLFLGSDLGDALIKRPDVNVSHLHTLIIVDVQTLVNNFRRSFDGERLVRTLGSRLSPS